MNWANALLLFGCIVGAAAVLALIALSMYSSQRKNKVRELVSGVLASSTAAQPTAASGARKKKLEPEDVDEVLKRSKEAKVKQQFTTSIFRPGNDPGAEIRAADEAMFRAGLITEADRKKFKQFKLLCPIVTPIFLTVFMLAISPPPMLLVTGIILGIFVGLTIPKSMLERKMRKREEETLYYLPLVIEQISIGVSSSLDLGPCIAHVLQLSRDRATMNPVTELLMYVEKLLSSGLSLQEALEEVGQASGIQQIKHTFKFLSQCAEHGGEISKQLQELANSVMTERQTWVEGKIASLPVKATGPLFLVFAGFFLLMMAGLFARLATSIQFS